MKKLLLILICFPLISLAQQTHVPDDGFEQALILQGYDIVLDDSVLTANINQLTSLSIWGSTVYDLTGIEDFTSLRLLYCMGTQLATLNLSNNQYLDSLYCDGNQLLTSLLLPNSLKLLKCNQNSLTTLDVSSCTNLHYLECSFNSLTTLDVSSNYSLKRLRCDYNQLSSLILNDTALTYLTCGGNLLATLDLSNSHHLKTAEMAYGQLNNINLNGADSLVILTVFNNSLITLDVSSNSQLSSLKCYNNNLTVLDLRNGNNSNLNTVNNPDLTCISVDDTALANNWIGSSAIDPQHYFSLDCNVTSINEITNKNKSLLKIVDVLGREVLPTSNTPLFYIYDDGTVEKKIIIE